jgi:hypothetical protein
LDYLRCLRFILYLPPKTKLEEIDFYWFNLNHHTIKYEINRFMVLYTVPYMLNSQRQVYNHSFGRQSTINNNIIHINWTINRDYLSINTTLGHFQHVNSLTLLVVIIKVHSQCLFFLVIFIYLGIEYKFSFLEYITPIFTSSTALFSFNSNRIYEIA